MDSAPTIITVAMALVATLAGTITGLLNFLEKRDSRRFDNRLLTLEDHRKKCEEDRIAHAEERAEDKKQLGAMRDRLDAAESKSDRMEGDMAGLGRELSAAMRNHDQMRADYLELRNKVMGK